MEECDGSGHHSMQAHRPLHVHGYGCRPPGICTISRPFRTQILSLLRMRSAVCRALRYLSLLHSSSATRLQSQREPGGPAKHRATFRFFVALLSWLVGTDQSRFGSLTMHRDFSSQPMLVRDVMTKKVTKAMFVGDYRRPCRKSGRPGPWGEGARSTLSGRP
jgi:hypothetical protein